MIDNASGSGSNDCASAVFTPRHTAAPPWHCELYFRRRFGRLDDLGRGLRCAGSPFGSSAGLKPEFALRGPTLNDLAARGRPTARRVDSSSSPSATWRSVDSLKWKRRFTTSVA